MHLTNTSIYRNHITRIRWVEGGIDRSTTHTFMVLVERRDAGTLDKIISDHVLPGFLSKTDYWLGYNGLAMLGYQYANVNHSIKFVNPNYSDTQNKTTTGLK